MTAVVDIYRAWNEDSSEEYETMSKDDDPSVAGKTNGVAGWEDTERRKGDRRARYGDVAPNDERRGPDRRQAQYCFVCGTTFQPTPMHKRICPACRSKALRMGGI